MQRITTKDLDTGLFEMIDNADPFVCQKSNYFTISPDPFYPGWETVHYFRRLDDIEPTYIRKYVDGIGVRWDKGPENDWLEDLKNLDI